MHHPHALYAQSGGVTPVINASAQGLIHAFRTEQPTGTLYAGLNGIKGVLQEALIDLKQEDTATLLSLGNIPGGAFGSARKKLQDLEKNKAEFERILAVCEAHQIGYFFYNGGNDSMDTVAKLHAFAKARKAQLQVIGIPKTIDNDLAGTDCSPGFGSVAKYVAVSMAEAGLDTQSMCHDSTKVFVLETMGRHAGWIAAASGLAAREKDTPPHLILFPELPFEVEKFLAAVRHHVEHQGYCTVTVSEGVKDPQGHFLSEADTQDAFGHAQLGGVGAYIQKVISAHLGYKTHGAVLDYCQRSARHLASRTDLEQALACGEKALALALEGRSGQMVTLTRESENPYRWDLGSVPAKEVANAEKKLPREYIDASGFHISPAFRRYALPLIQGEAPPPFEEGLPVYPRLKKHLLTPKLPPLSP